MGMDGFSIASTGIREQTSAEMNARTEQIIVNDPTNSAQQVQGLSDNERIREKEEEEKSGGQNGKTLTQEEFQDGLVEDNIEENPLEEFDVEDIENPNKEFYVKLNIKDDIIELYDSATNRLIETISGNELGELVQKLNMASGIFVNKKV